MSVTLYHFFHRHVQHGFGARGITEPSTIEYVSDLLTRFAHTSALYATTDNDGRPMETVAQFLCAWRRAQDHGETGGQALIMRHLGEYTLFMSGLFRDRIKSRGQLNYYLDHGRSAFWASAGFERNPGQARLFRRLYFDFERVSNALDCLRRDQLPLAQEAVRNPLTAMWHL